MTTTVSTRITRSIARQLTHRQYTRPYIGVTATLEREFFRSAKTPTEVSYPHYLAAIGAFRTARAPRWSVTYGANTPHAQTVSDCETLSPKSSSQTRNIPGLRPQRLIP